MNAPATQAEGGTLSKPVDWAVYMVAAALKYAAHVKMPVVHASPDDAKYDILETLNWLEAHEEYDWPDFSRHNFDFAQVMRLRRALVNDVFGALQKAGNIRIGTLGTPDSVGDSRRQRRPDYDGSRTNTARERLCKREADLDEEAMSEHSKDHEIVDAFLRETTDMLLGRCSIDVTKLLNERNDATGSANKLHDNLVEVWTGPLQTESSDVEMLKRKAEMWDRMRRSEPPRSTQREQVATPRVSSAVPQESPGTVQKSMFGPGVATKAGVQPSGGWTAANNWGSTNSMG